MRTLSFDLALQLCLLRGEIIVVLDQLFAVTARLVFGIVDRMYPIHSQQSSELKSINAITLAVDH